MTKKNFLDDCPKLKKEWNYKRNNELKIYPENVYKSSNIRVWWICEKNHEWQTTLRNRTSRNKNCPYCCNNKICKDGSNSLYFAASDKLKKEWNEEKNGSMKLYAPMSLKKVWWKCEAKGHEWEVAVCHRTSRNRNCPYCSNNKLCADGSNSFESIATDKLKKEWMEEKNGSMRLYSRKTKKKVWWKCEAKGHEWQTAVQERANGINCPYCSNRKMCEDGSNSFERVATEQLKKEWNEEKNGSMRLYSPMSGKKVWWICEEKGHEWESVLRSRRAGNNCPHCNQSKLELEFQKNCEKLQLNFDTQIKYKGIRNIKYFPYDASIKYENKEIRVELQGHQHFLSNSHYFLLRNFANIEYINRLNIDNKKSYLTLQSSHNFLSISHLCMGEISTILEEYLNDLEDYDILFRYYITPYIYLQYSECNNVISMNTEMCYEYTDEMLLVYRVFLFQIESIQNPTTVSEEDFSTCCGKLYFNDCLHAHKMLTEH